MSEFKRRGMKMAHRLTLPLSSLILNNSTRTRVIIIFDNQVLLQRSYMGSQRWSFPGGGVSRREPLDKAALREVHEEVGLRLNLRQLEYLGHQKLGINVKWAKADVHFFVVKLSKKLQPKVIRPLEIIEASWWPMSDLPDETSPLVEVGLSLLDSKS